MHHGFATFQDIEKLTPDLAKRLREQGFDENNYFAFTSNDEIIALSKEEVDKFILSKEKFMGFDMFKTTLMPPNKIAFISIGCELKEIKP